MDRTSNGPVFFRDYRKSLVVIAFVLFCVGTLILLYAYENYENLQTGCVVGICNQGLVSIIFLDAIFFGTSGILALIILKMNRMEFYSDHITIGRGEGKIDVPYSELRLGRVFRRNQLVTEFWISREKLVNNNASGKLPHESRRIYNDYVPELGTYTYEWVGAKIEGRDFFHQQKPKTTRKEKVIIIAGICMAIIGPAYFWFGIMNFGHNVIPNDPEGDKADLVGLLLFVGGLLFIGIQSKLILGERAKKISTE